MRIYTVDSFTDEFFKGNPAGVCILDEPAPDAWMQSLAAEMRHSETAFLLKGGVGEPHSLRWFTPTTEVILCGHATLATAHVLYSTGTASETLEFSTKSGILSVAKDKYGLITMDFPAKALQETAPPEGLIEALAVRPVWVGKNVRDYLVEVESEDEVLAVSPDFRALEAADARATIVTARASQSDADYVSRFFAPQGGVPEDPVTGSAHCALAPYWSAKLGSDTLVGTQLSRRGGSIRTTVRGDRVELAGRAVTVFSGTLHV
ncbi:PhzF family phenazine biosynthesis protein [Streptosporangium becharense]|uniref:PhzF family phenazine biosynthesis protein n=1 Tax=Streptosporangium becharense TaxID=1816182 RepID=A0A7W9IIB1_9ACTN|nr:PhzF family phenazine biosynthesis protein [Streptosporangium becharense]MBB2914778.1 PhzF family phenazine biosynthesis protein [Streptosporangium becharense]MBB5820821.1 PhzF family phenazine biosynthesis protein [Streptosporangium becharense]